MGVGIEALFTSALGLQEPWSVEKVELDTATSAHRLRAHLQGQSPDVPPLPGCRARRA